MNKETANVTMDEIKASASSSPEQRPSTKPVNKNTEFITRDQYVLDMAKLVKRVMGNGLKDGVAFNIVVFASQEFDQKAALAARLAQAEANAAGEELTSE